MKNATWVQPSRDQFFSFTKPYLVMHRCIGHTKRKILVQKLARYLFPIEKTEEIFRPNLMICTILLYFSAFKIGVCDFHLELV